MAAELLIHLAVGAIIPAWCDECFTSAGYRAEVLRFGLDGVDVMGWLRGCAHCGVDADLT